MVNSIYSLKDSISTDDLSEVFEVLNHALKGKDPVVFDEVHQLENRYFELKTNSAQGTMHTEFIQIEMNRIRRSLFALIDKLDDAELDKKEGDNKAKPAKNKQGFWQRLLLFFKGIFQPSAAT